jgi:hypothetical protein
MDRIILFQFESPVISINIQAYFDMDKLIIEGYDIGKRVSEAWGDSDYEYKITIPGDEVIKLYPLLEVNNGEKIGLLRAIAGKYNTNTCYSEFLDFLKKNGIRSEGYSWA